MEEQQKDKKGGQDTKKDVPATQSKDTSSKKSGKSISQKGQKRQGAKKPRVLSLGRRSHTMAVKFYDEQIVDGNPETLFARVRAMDKTKYHVIAIRHDKDEKNDGVWLSCLEKPHYHVIMRAVGSHDVFRVGAKLEELGIHFCPGLDDALLENRGVETVGNYAEYAMYLTHDTEQAKVDGKMPYPVEELVSNLNREEVQKVRDGYIRVNGGRNKVSADELAELDEYAFKMGYELKNFDDWYNEQPFSVRSNAKIRVIRESYNRGVEKRLKEDDYCLRTCIFIQGDGNTGKTFTSGKVMKEMGKSVLSVGGGGSGKFDNLRPDHDCIIIDDDVCPNMLNMCDNKICHAYRRNKNNPVWAGGFLIITSNLDFEEFARRCGLKTRDLRDIKIPQFEALETRFFMCKIKGRPGGGFRLQCTAASTRGTPEEQRKRADIFRDFQNRFNEAIKAYKPLDEAVVFDFVEQDDGIPF